MSPEKYDIGGPPHPACSEELVTYDEILASFAGAALPEAEVSQGIQGESNEKKTPPLPESFEKPGDFFRFLIADTGTPGKTPAITVPEIPARGCKTIE